MSFEKVIRIPAERVGVLVGRSGVAKARIEAACSVKLDIDSDTGEVLIEGARER